MDPYCRLEKIGEYDSVFKTKMPIFLNWKIIDSVITPAMTYGAETWSLTKQQKEKFAIAQRSMERLLLNITWEDKIRNKTIRSKRKVK
jgi:hypothetical protein